MTDFSLYIIIKIFFWLVLQKTLHFLMTLNCVLWEKKEMYWLYDDIYYYDIITYLLRIQFLGNEILKKLGVLTNFNFIVVKYDGCFFNKYYKNLN